ncbi:DedA family protein [Bacillus cereus group sp. N21]|uniref:DedA family protein n=1 Tax=Bacillus cereus group sp. N21 TaxID=2794591 RepID=UPI0018F5D2E0|nr:DedA family protein [Bacillus cereus group sp. N21]MBJ8030758.1 DedA family protein [Bacillus cereus group sp. N21]
MEQFILDVIEYLKQFSYFGVILALTFEFIPAEIVLPLVGYWVYEGDMNFWLAVLAGTIGGTTGPLTLYALGYYGGRPLLLKYGKYFFIKEEQIQKADHFFEKYGPAVAFLGRFIPGVRTLISVPCGIAKMNIWQFSIYTFIAMLPLTTLYVYVGLKLGSHWKKAGAIVEQYTLPILGVVCFIVIGMFIFKFVKKRNKAESM